AELAQRDLGVARQRRVADAAEHAQLDQMVLAEALGPIRRELTEGGDDGRAAGELDLVALAVVERHRLDRVEAVERPGEAGGRILPAGKDDDGLLGHDFGALRRSLNRRLFSGLS